MATLPDKAKERDTRAVSYFKAEEFACRCARPECDAVPLRPIFLAKLNALREIWGKPMIITSGRRCEYWNKEVGGADKSQHLHGNAVDIHVGSRMESDALAELADKVGFGGIGIYKSWIHIDDGPRRSWAG